MISFVFSSEDDETVFLETRKLLTLKFCGITCRLDNQRRPLGQEIQFLRGKMSRSHSFVLQQHKLAGRPLFPCRSVFFLSKTVHPRATMSGKSAVHCLNGNGVVYVADQSLGVWSELWEDRNVWNFTPRLFIAAYRPYIDANIRDRQSADFSE